MATVFQDLFNASSDTPLQSHSPDVGAGSWSESSWTTSDIKVVGGAGYARGNVSASSSMYLNSTLLEGDIDITVEFTLNATTNHHCGLLLRCKTDLSREYYTVYISSSTLRAEKWVAGALDTTFVNGTAIGFNSGTHTMRVTVIGGEIKVYFDGSTTAFSTSTDSSPLPDGYIGVLSRTDGRLLGVEAVSSASADTTPPTLISATATATGATTASGSVTTDEGNGTIYSVATTSSTKPSKAQVKAGQDHTVAAAPWDASQAISSTGAKSVSVTGLTAETTYYLHHMHEDAAANQSDVESSASFTTDAEVTFAGTISVTETLKNNTGTVLASQTGVKVAVLKATDMESVYEATATTDASGILSDITNAAIVAGSYHVAIKLSDGSVGITGAIEAV